MMLSEVPIGRSVMIEKLSNSESIYTILMAYGIYRGTEMTVIRNDHWQEMILLKVDGKRIAVRKKDVALVKVLFVNNTTTQSI